MRDCVRLRGDCAFLGEGCVHVCATQGIFAGRFCLAHWSRLPCCVSCQSLSHTCAMANPSVPDISKEISCWDCVNAMFYCVGPAHQFDRYYKDGRFDSCAKKVEELTMCMKLKVSGPEETKVCGTGVAVA